MSYIAALTEISAGSIQAGSEKTGASREAPGVPRPGLRSSTFMSHQRTRTGLFQTMLLTELITPEAVVPSLKVNSKKHALQELSDRAGLISGLAPREIFDVLLQRERLGSTGIGEGIAIPHGKLAGAKSMFGIFARLARPIDFRGPRRRAGRSHLSFNRTGDGWRRPFESAGADGAPAPRPKRLRRNFAPHATSARFTRC